MDMKEANAYINEPLVGPTPSEETGLNSHFRSSFQGAQHQRTGSSEHRRTGSREYPSPPHSARSSQAGSKNPFRNSMSIDGGSPSKERTRVSTRPMSMSGYPTPPGGSSPNQAAFPGSSSSHHRHEAFGSYSEAGSKSGAHTRTRSASLSERFPGDDSHKPLDIIRRDSKRAQRSPHLRRHHQPGADTIDRLDNVGRGIYHHDGPYDAALLARNTSYESSPVAAVAETNREALRATPRENIVDSVERHRPLVGTASVPPGQEDRFGRRYEYEEGPNMMIEHNPGGGPYKRWPGIDYHPDDIKGKGEPSFSIGRALKEHKARRSVDVNGSRGDDEVEMQERSPVAVGATGREDLAVQEHRPRRTMSLGKQVGSGLKKRIGSIRRSKND